MPLLKGVPFKPDPIPDNLDPDAEVFYYELTNEIFTTHDAFFDRFIHCSSMMWTCGRTGKSGFTFQEALDSERKTRKSRKLKEPKTVSTSEPEESNAEDCKLDRSREHNQDGTEDGEPPKKKKKKYPYDPKKYSMPVPEGFDPSLLTPTGKIDGRKLKSKKNQLIAQELMAKCPPPPPSSPGKRGRHKKKRDGDEGSKKENETKKKEDDAKKKVEQQAELARQRELDAKKKKEAAALVKQLEKQKKEEEKKKAAAFLANWDRKCDDLERDDLRRLPQPTPVNCEIPERLFGDALFVLESLFNLHELFDFNSIFPNQINYDVLEEMLLDRQEDGALGTVIQFLLRTIFDTQPTGEGYGLDDDARRTDQDIDTSKTVQDGLKTAKPDHTELGHDNEHEHDNERDNMGSEADGDEEAEDKDVRMNDLIGTAIEAAREVKKTLTKPLPDMELNSTNVTEILRLHLLQSGSFPKGRTIYNGWYSSREDPGLWLCMQEQDLIKKLADVTIYDLNIEERIKVLQTLINQLFTFIKTRAYIESASDQLLELRKEYRSRSAAFGRWERENCVKKMYAPKRKGDHQGHITDKSNGHNASLDQDINKHIDQNSFNSGPSGPNGDVNENDDDVPSTNEKDSHLKSCLKPNGTNHHTNDNDDISTTTTLNTQPAKRITFKTSTDGAIETNGLEDENDSSRHNQDGKSFNGVEEGENEQTFEELERNYQQNMVDYEDYQRERTIRLEELNEILSQIRVKLRNTQAIYGIHPIGRDRAYRRYWLFQTLPGLFVEQDDDYVGRCLAQHTPLESQYKKLFKKDNPLMHPIEADLIRTKLVNGAGVSSNATNNTVTLSVKSEMDENKQNSDREHDHQSNRDGNSRISVDVKKEEQDEANSEKAQSECAGSNGEPNEEHEEPHESEPSGFIDDMNFCTGDDNTCYVHGRKRPAQPRWWFFEKSDSIDSLVETLNKRGNRESELHDVLSMDNKVIKEWISLCPSYKLNKTIMEPSGIRRSRRLRGKGGKRRNRKYDQD